MGPVTAKLLDGTAGLFRNAGQGIVAVLFGKRL
jgi:hypothetical protein